MSGGPGLLPGLGLAIVALGCAVLSAALVIGLGSALQHRPASASPAPSSEAMLIQARH